MSFNPPKYHQYASNIPYSNGLFFSPFINFQQPPPPPIQQQNSQQQTHHSLFNHFIPQNPNFYAEAETPITPTALKIPTTPTRSKSLSPSRRDIIQPIRIRHKQQQNQNQHDTNEDKLSASRALPSNKNELTKLKEPTKSLFKLPLNMRTINLNNFPIQNNGKKVSNGLMKLKAMNNTNSVDCLDSLRKNIQKEINDKFKSIIDEYTNGFIEPALKNMKLNFGNNYVQEDEYKNNCLINILDDTKIQLINNKRKLQNDNDSINSNTNDDDDDDDDDNDEDNSNATNDSELDVTISSLNSNNKRHKTSNDNSSLEFKLLNKDRLINEKTLFVFGKNANDLINNNQTTSLNENQINNNNKSIYAKYPYLFKYEADQLDKQWLSKNNGLNRKVVICNILFYDDILKIIETLNNNVNLLDENYLKKKLKPFELPENILFKIKNQYRSCV